MADEQSKIVIEEGEKQTNSKRLIMKPTTLNECRIPGCQCMLKFT